ncbi:MAG: oligosaccharide flippase family protein [Clostridia bacterium]|nr:oligosaccharide flippase family protein [Clostridia bacterium]
MSREATAPEGKKLLRGVLVLMPAALFSKIVGMFYKIPLLFIVGVEGMAYFLAAYHVYSLLFVLSATGLPTALSLQISRALARGERRSTGRVLGVAMLLFLLLGLGGSALLFYGANELAARLSMGESAASLAEISPSLFLAAFIGAGKGYFQGHSRMGPTALCEVLEAAGKLGFGLGLALYAKRAGMPAPQVAAFAVLGITAGMALSALSLAVPLLISLVKARGEKGEEALPARRRVLFELCRVALPITLGACVMSVVSLLDTVLISARLQRAGFPVGVANAMYSSYGNLAIPLYNLVPALLSPVTLALMPLLGGAMTSRDEAGARGTLRVAVRLCALVGIPASLGLCIFARPLLSLIFAGQTAAIDVAAPLLSVLALSVLPAVLIAVLGGALQATGHTLAPVWAMGAGACVKLVCESMLLTLPSVYLYGAPISTLCCTLTVLALEWVALSRFLPFVPIAPRDLFWPLLAAVPAMLLGIGAYAVLQLRARGSAWVMLPVLLLVGGVMLLLSLMLGALKKEDLLALPAGDKLCVLLEKCKLLK